jgi:hypothetical protein
MRQTAAVGVIKKELETGKSVPGTLPPSHRPRVADAEAAKIKRDILFLESIFIDQATLNGTRPNSP